MIGNDLVDLRQAKLDSNWKRNGYLNKIFTLKEQHLITSSMHSDEMVWRLWSMKEAAYKIHNTKTGIRNFAPLKLVCSLDASNPQIIGSVFIDNANYSTETVTNSHYLHTIAVADGISFAQVQTTIYDLPHPLNYREPKPDCISHHGRFLALVYFCEIGKT